MHLKEFQQLSTTEVKQLISESGPKVGVWVINGTRRWYMLEHHTHNEDFSHDYLETINVRTIEIIKMFFDHGIDTLIMPILSPHILKKRSKNYAKMAIHAIEQLTIDQQYLDLYKSSNVKVGFYGDYQKEFDQDVAESLSGKIDAIKKQTAGNQQNRLFWGICAHDAINTVAQLSVEEYLKTGAAPNKERLIELYYGDKVDPIDLYISSSKPRVFDVPLISSGRESLYFTVAPSPYMDQQQFRTILYDHLFHRTATNSMYNIQEEDQERSWESLRHFYHINKGSTLGVGVRSKELGIWHPLPQVQVEDYSIPKPEPALPDFYKRFSEDSLLVDQVESLLLETGPGHNTITAYDTAWVAMLGDQLPDISQKALEWLRVNQLSNGSWGMNRPVYHHDRVLCTLAAVIALRKNNDIKDRDRVARGLFALHEHLEMLHDDLSGPTVGFEMILPTLISEAIDTGLLPPIDSEFLGPLRKARNHKLSLSPNKLINREVSMAFSAEMAGNDGQNVLAVDDLLEANGSVALSPSATAYFLIQLKPNHPQALEYIQSIWDNGVANFAPFDLFEQAWVMWNLSLVDLSEFTGIQNALNSHLKNIHDHWCNGAGIGFSEYYSPKDADDTAIAYSLLTKAGYDVPIDDILRFEREKHYCTFDFEAHSSVSTNVHVLFALLEAGYGAEDKTVKKILHFLNDERINHKYWIDKWHTSPYYVTSHAIIALADIDPYLAEDAIQWILDAQKPHGGWGHQSTTAEETAYCLQALMVWKKKGHYVPDEALNLGLDWLLQNMHHPYPPLWMAKCLYSPTLVVRSTIMCVLMLAKELEIDPENTLEFSI